MTMRMRHEELVAATVSSTPSEFVVLVNSGSLDMLSCLAPEVSAGFLDGSLKGTAGDGAEAIALLIDP